MHASVPWVSVGMVETEKMALECWSTLESEPPQGQTNGSSLYLEIWP